MIAIPRAVEGDAEAITAIIEGIVDERIYTAFSQPWSIDQQRRYLSGLAYAGSSR